MIQGNGDLSGAWAALAAIKRAEHEVGKELSQGLRSSKLSPRKMAMAAGDLANGMSHTAVAKKYNVGIQAVSRWLKRPQFSAIVDKKVAALNRAQKLVGIAQKHVRLRENQADYDAVCRIQNARAKRAKAIVKAQGPDAIEAGEETGFIAHRIKGKGMVESTFDRELVETKRMLREESAIEVGDRAKVDADNGPVTVSVVYVQQTIKGSVDGGEDQDSEPLTITATAEDNGSQADEPAEEESHT